MAENPRVGLLGGTFNPIHLGHLRAAEEVAEILGLTELRFVPSGDPPHKESGSADPMAPAGERRRWVELAIEGNPRFRLDDRELERRGPSFLVDTLASIGAEIAPERPVFLLGQDAFAELPGWREPETLLRLAHLAVMTRPGGGEDSLRACLPAALEAELELARDGRSGRHRSAGTWLRLVSITALDISASDVRRRLRESRSVRYLLPEAAYDAIVASGIYDPARRRTKAG